jgi:glucose-fructose oxidoreductase
METKMTALTQHPDSRRAFLRRLSLGTAAVAAGFGFAGSGNSAPSGTNSPAVSKFMPDGRKKLGVALLGLGHYAANELAPALQMTEKCYLAGAISGHPEKLQQWKNDYGLPDKNLYTYETMEQMADNPDIDIVYVVTPPALHPVYAIRAAHAGKHIISEKPMATTVSDCQAMIDACKASNVKFSLGYREHYDPYFKELIRLQEQKDFGDLMKMTGDRGFVFGQRAWRIDKLLAGGGPMMDLGIYLVQGACAAAGTAPVAVTARELPKTRPDVFYDVEETMDFTLEFPNGAVFTGVTSFNHVSDSFRAEGAKGWIDFQSHAFTYHVGNVITSRGPLNFPVPGPVGEHWCYQQAWQMDDFADCVMNNRETRVPGEMGLRDMKIIAAVYEAARTGQKVTV